MKNGYRIVIAIVVLVICGYSTHISSSKDVLSEDEAIHLMYEAVGDDRVRFMPHGIREVEGREAYSIRVFYDHETRIETKTFYYAFLDTKEVREQVLW